MPPYGNQFGPDLLGVLIFVGCFVWGFILWIISKFK